MDVIAVYDTSEKIDSQFTPDLLAELLLEHIPQSNLWVSVPDEEDLTGAQWTPQWTDIAGALRELETLLASNTASRLTIAGFSTDELVDELHLFCDELRAAREHTSRFYLCVY